jgi:hypothetical protein
LKLTISKGPNLPVLQIERQLREHALASHAPRAGHELEPLALRVAAVVGAQAPARVGDHAPAVPADVQTEQAVAPRRVDGDVHLGVRYEAPPGERVGAGHSEARGLAGAIGTEARGRAGVPQRQRLLLRAVRPRLRLVAGAQRQRRTAAHHAHPRGRVEEHRVRRRLREAGPPERALQGLDPPQGRHVARPGPGLVQHAVHLVRVQRALPEVVAPLQRPERPVQVRVRGGGGDASPVAVVVGVDAAVVDAELAEDDGPALVEQVERAAGHAGREARARVVGVARGPVLGVGEAVPVQLERHLPREAQAHRTRVDERQVVVEAQAGEDDQHARVRRVHRLRAALHVPACGTRPTISV